MEFPYLFSPITINGLEIKNRIVMTAMHLGYTPKGEVTDQLVDFYVERATGGAGLIIVGGCPVDEYGGMVGMIGLQHDRFIPGLSRLVREVKSAGAPIVAQLYQAGRYTHSAMIGGKKPFSASAVRSKLTGETPRALELDEIPQVQDTYAQAAVRARTAGFDGVEILGSAGYLISQFLSPITNLRDDAYGGPLENRMRFGLEVVRKVREAVSGDYPVFMRLAGNDFMEGGNTNQESRVFAAEAEKAGVDLFNVTGGWHETRVPQLTMSVPRKAYLYLAQGIKSAVGVPVLASNRINDPCDAEEILRNGQADMITMARGLIADPDLPNKARTGKAHLITHCVACNQGCFDSVFQGRPVTCMVNPRTGRERQTLVQKAGQRKRVLVIGGGVAGMKAAQVASDRGHEVFLAEKGNVLGGQLLLNRDIPGREELVTAALDLENNVKALDITLLMEKEVDVSFVKEMAPDAVILATGAVPLVPPIPGLDGSNVVSAWDLLAGKVGVGKRVVVLGGNAVGMETALYLASLGTLSPEALHFLMINQAESIDTMTELLHKGIKKVTVVEMTEKVGKDVGLTTRWTLLAELKRLGVRLMTGTEVVAIQPGGVEVVQGGEKSLLEADSIVVAAGSRPVNGLYEALTGVVPDVHRIGDASSPRNALIAIREAFDKGLLL